MRDATGAGLVLVLAACVGTVSHDGVGVVVVMGGTVVVVVGAVVAVVAHGSTGAGASDGAGVAGVVVGCANAPAVPDSMTVATAPAVNNDRAADRIRRRGGLGGIVMGTSFSDVNGSPMARFHSIL